MTCRIGLVLVALAISITSCSKESNQVSATSDQGIQKESVYRPRTILQDGWIDLPMVQDTDKVAGATINTENFDLLLQQLKAKGFMAGTFFDTKAELLEYIRKMEENFNLQDLDKDSYGDPGVASHVIENRKISLYISRWGNNGKYSIDAITIFDDSGINLGPLKIGAKYASISSQIGDYNYETKPGLNATEWQAYSVDGDLFICLKIKANILKRITIYYDYKF